MSNRYRENATLLKYVRPMTLLEYEVFFADQ